MNIQHRSDAFAAFETDDDFDGDPQRTDPGPLTGMFDSAIAARQFMTAGRATVTLESLKTGARFTYRISFATDKTTGKPSGDGTLFVGVLNGPDNNSNYKYLGRISRDIFWQGRRHPRPNDIGRDAPSMIAFDWTWRMLLQSKLPGTLRVWHEGRCNRKLTVPSSIASGFGPECIHKVMA